MLGLTRRLAACFTDSRDPAYTEHTVETLVMQRVVGIALGYEDLNDHDQLRHDPVLATLAGKLAATREDCAPLQHTACKLGQPLLYRGRRNLMPGSYSTDLRERVLVAVEAGEPADAVAEEFMVGRSSVYRWIAAARDEGRRAAKPIGGGPKPIIRDEIEATLCRLLKENNHLTLVECRDRLAEETGVRVNPWTIGRALRRLDWT